MVFLALQNRLLQAEPEKKGQTLFYDSKMLAKKPILWFNLMNLRRASPVGYSLAQGVRY